MHKTDLFIVSGADLKYTTKKTFIVNDAVLEYMIKNKKRVTE